VKVALNLTQLLDEGSITAAEFDRLAGLGRADTGTLLVNVLLCFGVVAVAVGCLLLVPNSVVGVMLGGVLMATGLGLFYARPSRMGTVGQHLHSRGGAASGRGNHAA
jgi:hypothetical protein